MVVLAIVGLLAWLGFVLPELLADGWSAEPSSPTIHALWAIPIAAAVAATRVAEERALGHAVRVATALWIAPAALALFTTPRGDDDGLWLMIVFAIPVWWAGTVAVAWAVAGLRRRRSQA